MGAGDVVGLIAGAGDLPAAVARGIRTRGHRLVGISVADAAGDLGPFVDHAYRMPFGQLREVLTILQRHEVRTLVMAGTVPRHGLLDTGDALFRQWLREAGDRRDQRIFHYVAAQMQRLGIAVASPVEFVPELLIGPGVQGRRAPSAGEQADIQLGSVVARTLAGLDVGQTVVLKDGVILAVEAAEGTDEAIRRGARMARAAVVVKTARPNQDMRFDLPTVGKQTVALLRYAGAAVLAVEAGKTLLLDRAAAVAAADEGGIAIVGIELTGLGVQGSGFGSA